MRKEVNESHPNCGSESMTQEAHSTTQEAQNLGQPQVLRTELTKLHPRAKSVDS